MRGITALMIGTAMLCSACGSDGGPATVPASVPVLTTTATTTPVPASTTTTLPPTSTSTTAVDRVAEIQAIFQDLEERRLQALYDGDREAFRALFANDEYMERSMGAFDVVEFDNPPRVRIEIVEVLADETTCVAAHRVLHMIDSGETPRKTVSVIEQLDDGWGFSYAGEGWVCDGLHPFSS